MTGPDKDVDVVVEIFNKLNSGGTKLSSGDLALARICAEWPDRTPGVAFAADEMAVRPALALIWTGCCATSMRS